MQCVGFEPTRVINPTLASALLKDRESHPVLPVNLKVRWLALVGSATDFHHDLIDC